VIFKLAVGLVMIPSDGRLLQRSVQRSGPPEARGPALRKDQVSASPSPSTGTEADPPSASYRRDANPAPMFRGPLVGVAAEGQLSAPTVGPESDPLQQFGFRGVTPARTSLGRLHRTAAGRSYWFCGRAPLP